MLIPKQLSHREGRDEIKGRRPIKCFAQGHSKRTCWLDLHTISLMLNNFNINAEHQAGKL